MAELTRYEYRKLVNDVADAVVAKLAKMRELANDRPRYVRAKEAAEILHRTEDWVRRHRDELPHKKLGGGEKQGQLLFLEDGLYKYLQR